MASVKQIAANRRNAQKSTGPKSDAGKNRSSRNAIVHGLSAMDTVLPQEDRQAFEAMREQLFVEYNPIGVVQSEIVEQLAAGLWRLRRIAHLEKAMFQYESSSLRDLLGDQDSLEQQEDGQSDDQDQEVVSRDMVDGLMPIRLLQRENILDRLSRYERSIRRGVMENLMLLENARTFAGDDVNT